MQAAVAGALAAVDWRAYLGTSLTWVRQQATSGLAMLLAMPSTCKLALTHAALVCSGQTPDNVTTPGFPPLSLPWGWLLVGLLLGVLLGVTSALMVSWWSRRQTDRARRDILNYITVGGQINAGRLQQLANAGGVTDVDILRRMANL